MSNPKLASRSCDDCKKWIYIEDGERAGEIATRRGKKVPRGSVPTPCNRCAKKSPELAYQYELSDRSFELIDIYWQSKSIAVKVDCATAQYLGVIARVYAEHEEQMQFKMWVGTMEKGSKGK